MKCFCVYFRICGRSVCASMKEKERTHEINDHDNCASVKKGEILTRSRDPLSLSRSSTPYVQTLNASMNTSVWTIYGVFCSTRLTIDCFLRKWRNRRSREIKDDPCSDILYLLRRYMSFIDSRLLFVRRLNVFLVLFHCLSLFTIYAIFHCY